MGCSLDGNQYQSCALATDCKEWLFLQLDKRRIPREAIREALLRVKGIVDDIGIRSSYGHQFADAQFSFDCQSEMKTEEKSYVGRMAGKKNWGF